MKGRAEDKSVDDTGKIGLWPLRAIFKDPIHRMIPVNTIEYYIIQHPVFNRLHGIRQLGFTYLVYPQAKHSRFEHSLGAMHLAGIIAHAFKRNSPELAKRLIKTRRSYDNFVQLARLAALLHDLGHLPYSHVTEEALMEAYRKGRLSGRMKAFVEEKAKDRAYHEAVTCELIKKLRKDVEREHTAHKKKISPIFSAILFSLCGERNGEWTRIFTPQGVSVVKEVVSGNITDVDRMDYLVRDAYNTGATYGAIDIERLADGLMLEERNNKIEIVAPSKIISNIEELYYARFMMYKWVYQHHTTIALDLTYRDALFEIDEAWNEIRKKLGKILPAPPTSLWDLFHPNNIWKYTVRKQLKIDDALVETLLRIAMCSNRRIEENVRRLLARKPMYQPIIKRQEDLIGLLHGQLEKRGEERVNRLLARLRFILQEGIRAEDLRLDDAEEERIKKQCIESFKEKAELLECIIEKVLEKRIEKFLKKKIMIKVYIAPPVSPRLIEQPLVLAGKNIIPLTEASLIIRAVHEAGLTPMIYAYYVLPRRNKRTVEHIRNELAGILLELSMKEGGASRTDEDIH